MWLKVNHTGESGICSRQEVFCLLQSCVYFGVHSCVWHAMNRTKFSPSHNIAFLNYLARFITCLASKEVWHTTASPLTRPRSFCLENMNRSVNVIQWQQRGRSREISVVQTRTGFHCYRTISSPFSSQQPSASLRLLAQQTLAITASCYFDWKTFSLATDDWFVEPDFEKSPRARRRC